MHIAISALTVAVAAIVVWWSLHPRRVAPERAGGSVPMRGGVSLLPWLKRATSPLARLGNMPGASDYFRANAGDISHGDE